MDAQRLQLRELVGPQPSDSEIDALLERTEGEVEVAALLWHSERPDSSPHSAAVGPSRRTAMQEQQQTQQRAAADEEEGLQLLQALGVPGNRQALLGMLRDAAGSVEAAANAYFDARGPSGLAGRAAGQPGGCRVVQ